MKKGFVAAFASTLLLLSGCGSSSKPTVALADPSSQTSVPLETYEPQNDTNVRPATDPSSHPQSDTSKLETRNPVSEKSDPAAQKADSSESSNRPGNTGSSSQTEPSKPVSDPAPIAEQNDSTLDAIEDDPSAYFETSEEQEDSESVSYVQSACYADYYYVGLIVEVEAPAENQPVSAMTMYFFLNTQETLGMSGQMACVLARAAIMAEISGELGSVFPYGDCDTEMVADEDYVIVQVRVNDLGAYIEGSTKQPYDPQDLIFTNAVHDLEQIFYCE